ncbi:MAG: histidinol-phosphatase HisJ family protein [Ruminococcus sp.]|nr:histidinol-phosphatase HisJ family protein [Ruminococcus sp.]
MLIDLHTHTDFSPDAKSSPEEMCARAAELGLTRFAVTDHCDCNYWLPAAEKFPDGIPEGFKDEEMCGARDYATASIKRTAELKERYPFLLCGIELGQPLQAPEAAAQILSMPELDLVIGSHHMNAGCADFYWLDYRSMDISEIHRLLERSFEEIYDMCRRADFDTLGHLTYPLRYIVGDCGIEVDMSRFGDIIREIFRTLAERGRGIEINTSGLRQKYGRTLPDREYVKLFKDCGGEILTIGSDAHCAADLAAGIPQGIDLARECGFRYVAYFEKRRAEFIKI